VRSSPLQVFISSVSSGVTLYTYEGDEITPCPGDEDSESPASSCEVPRSVIGSNYTSPFYVRIRPPFNEYGNDKYNFTFWALDGVNKVRSVNTALAMISVKSVNDPPVARSFTTSVIGDSIAILTLNATDIDGWKGPAAFAWGYIKAKPLMGDIYRMYLNDTVLSHPIDFDTESSPHALNVKPHAYTRNKAKATQSFAYVFTGNQSKLADQVTGVIATDTIMFYVEDINGQDSILANITVEVTRGIEAIAPTIASEYSVYEETWGDINLYGYDETLHPANLSFRIVSLPKYGTLRDRATGNILSAGDVIEQQVAFPYDASAVVEYLGEENYFNSPSVMWNGSIIENFQSDGFYFHVFRTGQALFYSSDVYVDVTVINVNDCPTLKVTAPDASVTNDDTDDEVDYLYSVKAVGAKSDAYKRWDNPNYEPLDQIDNFGISISDSVDKDVDFIKVRIKVNKGMVGFVSDLQVDGGKGSCV
jgi:hypothetical protein